jgi:Flp pilus assembly protein TadD/glutathione synthase/RimK-type ligase-like ATP-grasp enzyme
MKNKATTGPLDHARHLMGSGNHSGAIRLLGEILKHNRKNSEALGLLATALYLQGDKKQSKKLWKQSLDTPSTPMIFLSNLHAFIHSLMLDDNRQGATKQAARKLPKGKLDIRTERERDLLIELADMMIELEQHDSALEILNNATKALPSDAKLQASVGLIQMTRGDFSNALKTLTAVDQTIQPKTDLSLLVRIYQCAGMLGDDDLKQSVMDRAVNAHPVYIAPRSAGQKKNILIMDNTPKLSQTITSPKDLFLTGNYPTQLSEKLHAEFHFSSILANNQASRDAKCSLPKPDLIINNNVNGEAITLADSLGDLALFIDGFAVPVINHPNQAIKTTRTESAKLIKNISNLIAPKTQLYSRKQLSDKELVEHIEEKFDYPLITRTLTKQQGVGMTKVDDSSALIAIMPDIPDDFYVTQFVDSRGESGFYRKIRAAVVGNDIIIVRVDYDTHWNIHGRKSGDRVKFYKDRPELLAIESRICANPGSELGPAVLPTLREIRKRIPLEIFGIDFDVNPEGKVVFYEANASMNLFSTADPSVPYPAEPEAQLLSSFRRFLTQLE